MKWPWTRQDDDLDLEVRYHLERLADGYEREGMSRKEAMRKARAEFGRVEQIKEECRQESRWHWLNQWGQDLRFGWRMMRKTPSITVAAVVSLALGIGATTSILAFTEAVLWRGLTVPHAEQLVELMWESRARVDLYRASNGSNFRDGGLSVADFFSKRAYEGMKEQTAGKADVAGHIGSSVVSANYEGNVIVARMQGVTGNFFSVLQVQPAIGRLLTEREDSAGAARIVVVTDRFWKKYLRADTSALDRTIQINNLSYIIAGVLPASFHGITVCDETEIYSTIRQSAEFLGTDDFLRRAADNPERWWMQLIMRRRPEAGMEELRSRLDAAFASSWSKQPKTPEATPRMRLSDASRGLGDIRRQVGNPVLIMLGLVTVVLVLACANIANLLLARAAQREKEIALRISLGCGGGRLLRQFFTESLLLAGLGGVMSIVVTAGLTSMMLKFLPAGFEGSAVTVEPNATTLLCAAAVTMLAALLFGLYPAWRTTRVDAGPALKEGSGSAGTMSKTRWAPARLLVLVQVSLGVLLVTAAILFTSHLNGLVGRETGFDRSRVILFDLRPGELGYQGERLRQFYLQLEDRLGALQMVEAVGLARTRPMRGGGFHDDLKLPGGAKPVNSAVHHASAGFLKALGVPIIAGRDVTAQEIRSAANVAVLSEDGVKQLGLTSPLGAVVLNGGVEYTVVGVAANARYSRMTQAHVVTYLPLPYDRRAMTVVVRTTGTPKAALSTIRAEIQRMDRNLPMLDIYTMEEQIARTLQRERMFAWLCGSFGVLALVLCVVGLYGLMSHTTARRTPEMGIRIALGASRGDVIGQVVWEGMRLVGLGLALGIPLAIFLARVAEKQRLFPDFTVPHWTLAAAMGLLALSALGAVIGPAVRASSVDPIRALRQG
ncbi:MAG: ABC transporter permease [Acidobacteria bacterium]|nr:ABC transporter permease [Acidobacteriota bacterium]